MNRKVQEASINKLLQNFHQSIKNQPQIHMYSMAVTLKTSKKPSSFQQHQYVSKGTISSYVSTNSHYGTYEKAVHF